MRSWKEAGLERFSMNIINKSHGLKRLALSKLVSNLVFGHSFFKLLASIRALAPSNNILLDLK